MGRKERLCENVKKKTTISQPRREAWNTSFPHGPLEETNPANTLILYFRFQNCETFLLFTQSVAFPHGSPSRVIYTQPQRVLK